MGTQNSQTSLGGPPRTTPAQRKTIGKNGVIGPVFSRISFQVSQGLWGELWGKITPPFSLWFPLAKIPKIHREDPSQTTKNLATCPWEFSGSKSIGRRRPPKPPRLQVTTGKRGGFTAQISPESGFLWPGWLGAQSSQNILGGRPGQGKP